MAFTLGELARRAGAELRGDPERVIDGVATLQSGRPGAISFLANPRYRRYLADTRAEAVILGAEDAEHCPVPALVSGNPYATYAKVAALLHPPEGQRRGVHPSAVVCGGCRIDPSAWVGPNAVIECGAVVGPGVQVGPGCVVGEGATIGPDSRLLANVTVCHGAVIGARALIHPGVVIGSDGFGIANEGGAWTKVPQLGCVRIGDDVEIGANTTIDRGALEDTVIEDGVKLDNQIQVAHNVRIGAHTAIAGCTGIAGSARIGSRCTIGGGVGIVGHLEIADNVHITGMSLVTRSISEPGVYSSGTPLQRNDIWHKNFVRFKQLDDMARRLRALEKALAQADRDS